MNVAAYELSVLVSGRPVREYGHQGRAYIEGRKGSTFTLRFRNNSAQRVLAVPSVDGLSVVDGSPATHESRGYVVPGYSSVEFKGWRESLERSSEFVFSDRTKAYASQTVGDQNLGAIGVLVFGEVWKFPSLLSTIQEHHHHHHHYHGTTTLRGTTADWEPPTYTVMSSPTTVASMSMGDEPQAMYCCAVDSGQVSAKSSVPDFNLGVGWGQSQEDRVSETSFERGSVLATLELYYSDAAGLTAAGIVLSKDLLVEARALPRAFGGFCTRPKHVV